MKIYSIILLVFVAGLMACTPEEEVGTSILDTSNPQREGLDKFIYDNYTLPYNMEIKYRWDDSEVDNSRFLTPIDTQFVRPFLNAVTDVWIEPFESNSSAIFAKQNMPKLLYLVGSKNFNEDGTVTLGFAEGGRKVVVFDLNAWDSSNRAFILQTFRLLHHEFTHILNQKKNFPQEFETITPGGFTSTWFNSTDGEANALGFVTAYSRASAREDFAEMVASMFTLGQDGFEALVDEQSAEAQEALKEKEELVVTYYKQEWDIDFYKLQSDIISRIDALVGG